MTGEPIEFASNLAATSPMTMQDFVEHVWTIITDFAALDPLRYDRGFLSEPGDWRCRYCTLYQDPPWPGDPNPPEHAEDCLWRRAREAAEAF